MTQLPNKGLEYYLSLPYTIELTPDEDGYWFAKIPLLSGCISQGASREEALAMIDDAKSGWLELASEDDEPIPEPSPQSLIG